MYQDIAVSTWVLENISQKNLWIGHIAKFLSNINSWGQMWLLIMLILIVYNNLVKSFAHSKNYKYFCNSKKQHLNKQHLT